LAAQLIKAGENDIIVSGGMESMSRAAFMVTKARWGYRLGHGQLIDPLVLFDPISGFSLGEIDEKVADLYEMKRRHAEFGLVTMCIAGGQGIAMIVENEQA
jgi:acetyl-CoA C-acetyltransferase